jgi:predicted AAA+ superfamily ATPase
VITRIAAKQVKELSESFKAIAIVGPRQSGKTTLARDVFKGKQYVSFENYTNGRKILYHDNFTDSTIDLSVWRRKYHRK